MASDANGNGNGNGCGVVPELSLGSDVFNIIAADSDDNVIISPLLLEALLTLLYLGSDGSTAEQLQRALHIQRFANNTKMVNHYATQLHWATQEAADTRMQLCSRLLMSGAHGAVADEFQRIAQKYFQTVAVAQSSSQAHSSAALRTQLNELLAQAAASCTWRFDDMLLTALQAASMSNVNNDATALLAQAVHFQNKWFLPFSAYRTGIYDFQLCGSEATQPTDNEQQPATTTTSAAVSVSVPMLFDDDMFVKFGEFRELDARAIELPYEHDDELAMLVVLPNQRDGLAALEQQLRTQELTALTERMQMESVQVLLPKFKIDFECSLRQCLTQLGITNVFSNEANFKNLLREKSATALQISDILQKVCIEVNESGSDVPCSVTALKPIVISNSINGRHKFFRADHPFFFAIRNRDVTYFMGHVRKF